MNIRLLTALCALLALTGLAIGQAPAPKPAPVKPSEVQLFGDRFRPLKYEEMTPAQKTMITNLLNGERGTTSGPFNVLLRSPEMGDIAQKLGARVRFHSGLPDKLKELAIILTARHWNSQYEWYAHRRLAERAGLSEGIIEAVRTGRRPTGMTAEEEAIYDFSSELLRTTQVSDATYARAVKMFGEEKVVNVIGTMGYYCLVAMALNVDRYPLPGGAKPELEPLR
jgi:4-carboxymuconolactone decarboxylase